MSGDAISSGPRSVRIRVRLTPKSSRDAIEGEEALSDGSSVLVCRVRALPEDSAANVALQAMLAKATGVAKTRISVVTDTTSRIKIIEIEGDPVGIAERLRGIMD